MSMGYPAWNLLYYSVLTSLTPTLSDRIVVETGTNRGLSTIAIAQAIKDLGLETVVESVDRDHDMTEKARRHLEAAGLTPM